MSVVLIGDVHGKIHQYKNLIANLSDDRNIIQLGDFGFIEEHNWFLKNISNPNHKILFGNHDYYPYVKERHSLGDFGYLEDLDIFYIRGASSIDKNSRIPGISWFQEEELNAQRSFDCFDLYSRIKPKKVISHDCPPVVQKEMFKYDRLFNSSTGNLLNAVFEVHKPNNWYFGHHHSSKTKEIGNTIFQCLDELEYTII